MCTNMYWTINRYSRQRLLVKCGKCPACQQEKANKRSRRILNHSKEGEVALFFTLTYVPIFLPYIDRRDISKLSPDADGNYHIPVYRDWYHRYFKSRSIQFPYSDAIYTKSVADKYFNRLYSLGVPFCDSRFDLSNVPPSNRIDELIVPSSKFNPRMFSSMKSAKGSPRHVVGISYYSDIQNFFKRLRINLKRVYNYEKSFSYYCCSEYGPTTDRPHFHGLIYVPSSDVSLFREAIVKSWPYACQYRTRKFVEVAKNASSYVASYVNSSNSRISLLQGTCFAQAHSYSKCFGVRNDCFSLPTLLEKIDRSDLRYSFETVVDHIKCSVTAPIPKYVINRYFPKFKGYSLLGNAEISRLLLSPRQLASLVHKRCYERDLVTYSDCGFSHVNFFWTDADIHSWSVRMLHIKDYFMSSLGWSEEDFYVRYPRYYVSCWTRLFCNCMFDLHSSVTRLDEYLDFYDNVDDLFDTSIDGSDEVFSVASCHSDLTELFSSSDFEHDVNSRSFVVRTSSRLTELYHQKDKFRKVMNSTMSDIGYDV